MDGKWNNEFRKVNLIKEIKLRRWLKASFYDSYHSVNVISLSLFQSDHIKRPPLHSSLSTFLICHIKRKFIELRQIMDDWNKETDGG